jgi:hypothetical protein
VFKLHISHGKYNWLNLAQNFIMATIANTEDNLQKAAHKLHQIITEHSLTTSVQKTQSMAFKGQELVTSKIVIDNKIIEQVNS